MIFNKNTISNLKLVTIDYDATDYYDLERYTFYVNSHIIDAAVTGNNKTNIRIVDKEWRKSMRQKLIESGYIVKGWFDTLKVSW